MSLPLPNTELTKSTTPGLDDAAARFERYAVPLLDRLYRAARRHTEPTPTPKTWSEKL